MFNKSTRSYFFRSLIEDARHKHRVYRWGPHNLTWTEARLMFKGATAAAIYRAQQEGTGRRRGTYEGRKIAEA